LILIDIYGDRNEELPEKILTKAKKSLYECCMLVLRKGDMFADYSKSQVILMITLPQETDVSAILARISDQFYEQNQRERVHLKFDTQNN
jgi:hypothetical protein